MTLDEILRKHDELEHEWASTDYSGDWAELVNFRMENFARLAATARAGDRLYDYAHHAPICTGDSTRPCTCGLVEALAAWDAAAVGAR